MGALMKKIAIAVAGALASYYAAKTVTAALERKPLKARMRDGKQKAVDMKNGVVHKAVDAKDTVMSKAEAAKAAATAKAHKLYDGGEGSVDGYPTPAPEPTTFTHHDDFKKDL